MSKTKTRKYALDITGIDEIFQMFLDYINLEKRSDQKTSNAYRTDVFTMLEYFQSKYPNFFGHEDFSKLEREHLEDWIGYLINEKKYKEATVRRKKISMRCFVSFLFDHLFISAELHHFFPVTKNEYQIPKEVPTREEVHQYIDAFNTSDLFIEARDYLMVKLLYQTGVRISELLHIKKTDFKGYYHTELDQHIDDLSDIPANEHHLWTGVIFIEGKRGKQRYVLFMGTLYQELQQYQISNRLSTSESKYFFHSTHNKAMSRQNFYNRVKKYLNRDNLDTEALKEKFTPHKFRHAFGSHHLKRIDEETNESVGLPIENLAKLMGHSELRATEIYTKMNEQSKHINYKKYHPRS